MNLAFLNGKKTYIVAGVTIVYAWVSVWAGTMDFNAAMEMTLAAIGASTVHHAVVRQGTI